MTARLLENPGLLSEALKGGMKVLGFSGFRV